MPQLTPAQLAPTKGSDDYVFRLVDVASKTSETVQHTHMEHYQRLTNRRIDSLKELNKEHADLRKKQAQEGTWSKVNSYFQCALLILGIASGVATGGASGAVIIAAAGYKATREAAQALNLEQRFVYLILPNESQRKDNAAKTLAMFTRVLDTAATVTLVIASAPAAGNLAGGKVMEMGKLAMQVGGVSTQAASSTMGARLTWSEANLTMHSAQYQILAQRGERALTEIKAIQEALSSKDRNLNEALDQDHQGKIKLTS